MTGEKGRLWTRAPSVLPDGRTVLCRNKRAEQSGVFDTVALRHGKARPTDRDTVLHHTNMHISEEAEEKNKNKGTSQGR